MTPPFIAVATCIPDAASPEQTGTTVSVLTLLDGLLAAGPVTLYAPAAPRGRLRGAHALALHVHPADTTAGRAARAWRSMRHGLIPAMVEREHPAVRAALAALDPSAVAGVVLLDDYAAIYLGALPPDVPVVLIRHNVYGDSYAQHRPAGGAAALRHRYHHWLARRFDRWTSLRAHVVVAGSDANVRLLAALTDASRVRHIPTTAPRLARGDATTPADARVALFVGNFVYEPNAEAVAWFIEAVAPRLGEAARRDLTFRFVGQQPPTALLARVPAGVRVELPGYAADLEAELGRATLGVVPLRSGSGVKMKTLTLLAAGLPVVSTTVGIEGIPVQDGEGCLVADDAGAFADAIERLRADAALRERLARGAVMAIDRHEARTALPEALADAVGAARRVAGAVA